MIVINNENSENICEGEKRINEEESENEDKSNSSNE